MSVHELLCKRAEQGKQIRVGMIGAGRYGAMYLAQSRFIPGIQIVAIADLDLEKARKALLSSGYPGGRSSSPSPPARSTTRLGRKR